MKSARLVWLALTASVLVVSAVSAGPVFHYSFPASWDGTAGATVTDLSSAGNNGIPAGGATLSDTVPPGAPAGTKSLKVGTGASTATRGGVGTVAKGLLNNTAVAAAGGFHYDVTFMWDGGMHPSLWSGFQKVMDYAGTESLQIQEADGIAGTANLYFITTAAGTPEVRTGPSIPIQANTWYRVSAVFDTQGNTVAGDGSLAGLASLEVTPLGGAPSAASLAVTKTTYGDELDRAIAVGAWAGNSASVYLHGLIYDASVSLLPEPTTMAFVGLGGLALLRRRRDW